MTTPASVHAKNISGGLVELLFLSSLSLSPPPPPRFPPCSRLEAKSTQQICKLHYDSFQSNHLKEKYDEVIRAYTANPADFPPPYDSALFAVVLKKGDNAISVPEMQVKLPADPFWRAAEGRQHLEAVRDNTAGKYLE